MVWTVGENSTMYSQMERRQSISLFHIDLFSGDSGPNLWQVPNTVAAVKNKKRICFKKKKKQEQKPALYQSEFKG
jgi:hypothetical protein